MAEGIVVGWSWEHGISRLYVHHKFGAAGQSSLRKASVGFFRLSWLYALDLILLLERTRNVPHEPYASSEKSWRRNVQSIQLLVVPEGIQVPSEPAGAKRAKT